MDVDALEVRVVSTVGADEPQPAATTIAMTRRNLIGRFWCTRPWTDLRFVWFPAIDPERVSRNERPLPAPARADAPIARTFGTPSAAIL